MVLMLVRSRSFVSIRQYTSVSRGLRGSRSQVPAKLAIGILAC